MYIRNVYFNRFATILWFLSTFKTVRWFFPWFTPRVNIGCLFQKQKKEAKEIKANGKKINSYDPIVKWFGLIEKRKFVKWTEISGVNKLGAILRANSQTRRKMYMHYMNVCLDDLINWVQVRQVLPHHDERTARVDNHIDRFRPLPRRLKNKTRHTSVAFNQKTRERNVLL